jgi:hypothetical protein
VGGQKYADFFATHGAGVGFSNFFFFLYGAQKMEFWCSKYIGSI